MLNNPLPALAVLAVLALALFTVVYQQAHEIADDHIIVPQRLLLDRDEGTNQCTLIWADGRCLYRFRDCQTRNITDCDGRTLVAAEIPTQDPPPEEPKPKPTPPPTPAETDESDGALGKGP